MPSAIVTGATGILGREIVRALGKDPKQWETVHALSRSPNEQYPSNVKHDFIDLTGDAKEMAQRLKGAEVECVFFAAYLQNDTEQENWGVNGAMLKNFLDAPGLTGASKKIKRIILTCGAKQYGVHLGPPKKPHGRTRPLDRRRWPSAQFLLPSTTHPSRRSQICFLELGGHVAERRIHCAVSKEIGGTLLFPRSPLFYIMVDCFTYSRLHANFNLWAAMERKQVSKKSKASKQSTPRSWHGKAITPCSRIANPLRVSHLIDLLTFYEGDARLARAKFEKSLTP